MNKNNGVTRAQATDFVHGQVFIEGTFRVP
jgi:hypothetical protein